MTIEAALTCQFGITFIDARALATEAKLNLKITGYPSKKEREDLIKEASRIYGKQPGNVRKACQQRRMSLESVKSASGSSACSSVCSEASFDISDEFSISSNNSERRRLHFRKALAVQLNNVVLGRKRQC
jgi:hypothetical protein